MMKKAILTILILSILGACTKKEKSVELAKGSREYKLAEHLSKTLAYLDPEKNNVWVSSNEFDIRTSDLLQCMREIYGNNIQALKQFKSNRLKKIFTDTAKELAQKKLMLNRAVAAGIRVQKTEIDSMLSKIMQANGGEEKFHDDLKKNGRIIDDVRKDLENRLYAERYMKKIVRERATVTDAEILEAYKQDKFAEVREILLKTSGKSDSAKQKIHEKLKGIIARAQNGADFIDLVRKYSEHKESIKNGGLYRITRGEGEERVKQIHDAAFSLPVGAVSNILKTTLGYHVIKVVRRYPEPREFSLVREELARQIKANKSRQAFTEHYTEIEKEGGLKVIEF